MIAQPAWYKWAEDKLDAIDWLVYAVAGVIMLITAVLLVMAAQGKPVKTILTAWIVYLVSP